MRVKIATVATFIIGVGLFGILFGMQYFLSSTQPVNDTADSATINDRLHVAKAKVLKQPDSKMADQMGGESLDVPNPSSVQKPGPEIEKLNAQQREIGNLSDTEITEQAATIKQQIRDANLVQRLNKNQVTEDERKAANELLVRLALLGAEKARRGFKAQEPELGHAFEKREEDMASAKEGLKNEH